MILATKQGQNAPAQPDSKPYTNHTPRCAGGDPCPKSQAKDVQASGSSGQTNSGAGSGRLVGRSHPQWRRPGRATVYGLAMGAALYRGNIRSARQRGPELWTWSGKKCFRRGAGCCSGLPRCAVAWDAPGSGLRGLLLPTVTDHLRGCLELCARPGA